MTWIERIKEWWLGDCCMCRHDLPDDWTKLCNFHKKWVARQRWKR